jgi:hypothetical protein
MYISQKISQGGEDAKARLSSWRVGQLLNPQTSVTKRVFDTRLLYASLNDTHSDQLRNLLTKEFI